MNNSIKNWRGEIIGFRCWKCREMIDSMMGEICNTCRDEERRHQELMSVLKDIASGQHPNSKTV